MKSLPGSREQLYFLQTAINMSFANDIFLLLVACDDMKRLRCLLVQVVSVATLQQLTPGVECLVINTICYFSPELHVCRPTSAIGTFCSTICIFQTDL